MSESQARTASEAIGNLVQYRVDGGVAVLTLNAPPANTYSYEMMRELDRSILDARMDGEGKWIVITGNGNKFFGAGADIKMLTEVTPTKKYYFCLHANKTLLRFEIGRDPSDPQPPV